VYLTLLRTNVIFLSEDTLIALYLRCVPTLIRSVVFVLFFLSWYGCVSDTSEQRKKSIDADKKSTELGEREKKE